MAKLKKSRTITITDEVPSLWVTYVWTARIPSTVTLTQAQAKPMRQIIKYVKVVGERIYEKETYPFDIDIWFSRDRMFVWNDRDTLTYDE